MNVKQYTNIFARSFTSVAQHANVNKAIHFQCVHKYRFAINVTNVTKFRFTLRTLDKHSIIVSFIIKYCRLSIDICPQVNWQYNIMIIKLNIYALILNNNLCITLLLPNEFVVQFITGLRLMHYVIVWIHCNELCKLLYETIKLIIYALTALASKLLLVRSIRRVEINVNCIID